MSVARVAVDVPLAHLDRLFDYEVPEALAGVAVVGARVQVRFSGQQQRGWIVELADASEHPELARLGKVISPEPIVTPRVYEMIRAVAEAPDGAIWLLEDGDGARLLELRPA